VASVEAGRRPGDNANCACAPARVALPMFSGGMPVPFWATAERRHAAHDHQVVADLPVRADDVSDAAVDVGREPAVEPDLPVARLPPRLDRPEVQEAQVDRLLDLVRQVAEEDDYCTVRLGDCGRRRPARSVGARFGSAHPLLLVAHDRPSRSRSARGRTGSKVLMTTDFRRQPTYPSAASVGVMNEITTAEMAAGRLMSTPVVAVTIDHSLAAAWEAMRHRRVHHVAVLDDLGLAAVLDDRTVAC
jgi:CBS domain-containing protein